MLGVDLVINFRMPFFAKNIQDYWNRWHISLSHWMRDYLFQPLVRTGLKPALAAFATMVLIGIWHGAAWKYLAFGIWHGLLLALFDRTRRLRRQVSQHLPPRLWKILGTLATFHAAWLGLSIFGCKWLGRWPDMAENIVNHLVWDRDGGILLIKMIYFISPLLLLHAVQERRGYDFHEGCRGPLRLFLCGALLLSILHHGVVEGGVFVYFQF
jgi:alginate O-acetyltransferase complex protein AlgI